jgi:hypothetical protein
VTPGRNIALVSADGKQSLVISDLPNYASNPSPNSRLVFNKYGNDYFLAQVWPRAKTWRVTHSSASANRDRPKRPRGDFDGDPGLCRSLTTNPTIQPLGAPKARPFCCFNFEKHLRPAHSQRVDLLRAFIAQQ